MNDLVILENINAVEVFNGQGLDDLLVKITEEAKSIIPDLTTKKGRDEIASMAHKVAKAKTYLDGLRKDLVSEWKTKAKAVDAEGKKMRDTLDVLKTEVRQPLTEWENAENERVEAHERNIKEITSTAEGAANNWMDEDLQSMLSYVESFKVEDFDEFSPVAASAKDRAITSIKESIEKRENYDKEQAELEKLRAEAAEREQKDHEEKLRLEGEERAKREAEAKAEEEKERVKLESEKIEKEKNEALQAKIFAEKRALEVEKNAKIEAEKAAQAERDRIESERLAEEIAAKKREANKTHKTKINNAVLDALVLTGMNKTQAKKAVTAIAKGEVPYTTISY
jgi:hypothetical protein